MDMLITRLEFDAVTLGVSLRDCSSRLVSTARARIYDKVRRTAGQLPSAVDDTMERYGALSRRTCVAVSPIATLFDGLSTADYVTIAETLDQAARDVGVSAIGGFTALCSRTVSSGDSALFGAIPLAIGPFDRICASVELARYRRGVNVSAADTLARMLVDGLRHGAGRSEYAQISVLTNASGTSPYLPGAFHGLDEPEVALRIAVRASDALAHLDATRDPSELLSVTADSIRSLRRRLAEGGQFIGERICDRLSQRSGVDVRLDRVVVSASASDRNPLADGDPGEQPAGTLTGDLEQSLAHTAAEDYVSGSGSAFVARRIIRVRPDQTPADVARLLIRRLSDEAGGGMEVESIVTVESAR